MTSLADRKQKVNELRKAHFPFGFESGTGSPSQYRSKYLEYQLQKPELQIRQGSHFHLATDGADIGMASCQTEFQNQFQQHEQRGPQAVLKSNDANNIILGFGNNQHQTNYQNDFAGGQADRAKQVNQRLVSIELGDTLTDFTTSYNGTFQGVASEKREKPTLDLRQTNIVLGYGNNNYQTSSLASYSKKATTGTVPPAHRQNQNSIVIGNDPSNFNSEQRQQFLHKNTNYQAVDKDRVLDFKRAHFQLGFEGGDRECLSEVQHQYKEKPISNVLVHGGQPISVDIRHDNNNYFSTSYSNHFDQKLPLDPTLPNKEGRKDNVIIGMGTQNYTTQSQDKYNIKPISFLRGKGAEPSLELGDGQRDFQTQYRQTFTKKNDENHQQGIRLEGDSKTGAHFVTGFSDPEYKLHSESYGDRQGEVNRLSRETIDKMRNTNIVYGESSFEGKTIHASSYGWKKNDHY